MLRYSPGASGGDAARHCGVLQEAPANLRDAAQARLDGMGEPGRIAVQEMGVEIDEAAITGGNPADGGIHSPVVLAGEPWVDPSEVPFIVAEGWIIDIADEYRTDRKIADECIERHGEVLDAGAVVYEQALEQVVAADGQYRNRLAGRAQVPALRWQAGHGCPIDGTVLEPDRAARGEILPLELREEAVFVAHQELPGVQPGVVVPAAVENGVAERVEGEHHVPREGV